MNKSRIEWTDVTWNPVTGCTPISPGCENCYAKRMASRLRGRCGYPEDEPFRVTIHPDRLNEPFAWKKSKRVFVCSMSDLFHDDVPFDFIQKVFDVMVLAKQHTFLLLTKRPQKMNVFMKRFMVQRRDYAETIKESDIRRQARLWAEQPPRNIWIGVTVENQESANKRIPLLLQTPAAVHFVSCEPLLGPVDLRPWIKRYYHGGVPGLRVGDTLLPPSVTGKSTLLEYAKKIDPNGPQRADRVYLTTDLEAAKLFAFAYPCGHVYRAVPALPLEDDPDCKEPGISYQTPAAIVVPPDTPVIDWVICGGETGPGARPMHPDWVRKLRDQAVAVSAKVPFFFKSWGDYCYPEQMPPETYRQVDAAHNLAGNPDHDKPWNVGKKAAGRFLDGRTWDEMPEPKTVSDANSRRRGM